MIETSTNGSSPSAPFCFRRVTRNLVRGGGSLASLELLEVPVADLHVAVVVVHALGEVLGGNTAVVAPLLLLLVVGRGLGRLLGRSGGAAAEEAADGVAD